MASGALVVADMAAVDDERAHFRSEINLAFFADSGHPCEVAVEEFLHLIGEICHDAVLSFACPWNADILSDYGKKPRNACSPNVNNITYEFHLKPNSGKIAPVPHFAVNRTPIVELKKYRFDDRRCGLFGPYPYVFMRHVQVYILLFF